MSEKKTIGRRFSDFKNKYFPERQLFLRSEGRVRFVTFGSNTQMAIALITLISLGWGATATVAYVTRNALLEEKDIHIATMSDRYKELSGDFSILEKEIEKRAKNLEERQKLLEELAGVEAAALEKLKAKKDKPSVPAVKSEKDTETNDKASETKDSRFSLAGLISGSPVNASTIEVTDLDPRMRRWALLSRLDELEKRQRLAIEKMLSNLDQHKARVDEALEGTNVKVATLLKKADVDTNAVGGPYIPDYSLTFLKGSADEKLFNKLLDAYAQAEVIKNSLDSLPIEDPAADYYISSKFGRRKDPFKKEWAIHKALDMAGWPGTEIRASAAGKVVRAKYYGPYGRMIEIDHGNGFKTRYGHMRKLRVKEGQQVKAGQHIGDMGQTGRATSSHLHFEVWFDGKVRDPLPYLKAAENVRKIKKDTPLTRGTTDGAKGDKKGTKS